MHPVNKRDARGLQGVRHVLERGLVSLGPDELEICFVSSIRMAPCVAIIDVRIAK